MAQALPALGGPKIATSKEPSIEERVLAGNVRYLLDVEIMALVATPKRRGDVLGALRQLIDDYGGLHRLPQLDALLLRHLGLNEGEAARLLGIVEMARRIARADTVSRTLFKEPATIARYLTLQYASLDQEVLGAIFLDPKLGFIACKEIFRGSLRSCKADPRPILKLALLLGASSFVVWHNHPSGDPTPSLEDHCFTERLHGAAKLCGLQLRDHLVLGSLGRWSSMRSLSHSWD